MTTAALNGIRILDISRSIAGSYCIKLLADWGARVDKFQTPNPKFQKLIKNADVLIEDFAPGELEKLGFGYAALEKINPCLVMTSITGFGQDGLYSRYKFTPIVAYAIGGQMYINGDPGREPLNSRVPVSEYIGGLYAFIGTMAALESAAQTGKGQHVDISIMECLAASHQYTLTWPAYSGSVLTRPGWPGLRTPKSIYACKDGYINLRLQSIDMAFLAYLFEMPELAADPRFSTPNDRYKNRKALESIVTRKLKGMYKKDFFMMAGEWRQLAGYVATIEDLLADPQYKARDFWQEIDHSKKGKVKVPGAPVKLESGWKAGEREKE